MPSLGPVISQLGIYFITHFLNVTWLMLCMHLGFHGFLDDLSKWGIWVLP